MERPRAEEITRGDKGKRSAGDNVLELRSELLLSWFSWYARRYVARHFHAVRISREGKPPKLPEGPVLVVLNHPSWWDPLVCLVLTRLLPDRKHFAPMEANALKGYRFFRRLGFFPIEPGSLRGAAAFLRVSSAILSSPGTALWVTAQGEFVDPRERPAKIRPGVAHLARQLDYGGILPLALEYPFWDERFPEGLARFGEPLDIKGEKLSVEEWTRRIESGLEATQDALANEARKRDPAAFESILKGKVGVGGVYDLWRAILSRLRGRSFQAAHGRSGPSRTSSGQGAPS